MFLLYFNWLPTNFFFLSMQMEMTEMRGRTSVSWLIAWTPSISFWSRIFTYILHFSLIYVQQLWRIKLPLHNIFLSFHLDSICDKRRSGLRRETTDSFDIRSQLHCIYTISLWDINVQQRTFHPMRIVVPGQSIYIEASTKVKSNQSATHEYQWQMIWAMDSAAMR